MNELVPEKLVTIGNAALSLGLPPWKLRRAIKAGVIPTMTLYNSRRLVRITDVLAALEATKTEGPHHG